VGIPVLKSTPLVLKKDRHIAKKQDILTFCENLPGHLQGVEKVATVNVMFKRHDPKSMLVKNRPVKQFQCREGRPVVHIQVDLEVVYLEWELEVTEDPVVGVPFHHEPPPLVLGF